MGGMTNKPSLYDTPQTDVNPLDEWARSEDRGGSIDLKHPNDIAYVQQAVSGILNGSISEEGARNLATRVKGIAPHVYEALAARNASTKANAVIGQYFSPAVPERVTQAPVLNPNAPPEMEAQAVGPRQTQITPAQPMKADYQSAIAALNNMGQYKTASELASQQKTLMESSGVGKEKSGKLRTEFINQSKDFVQVRDSYERIKESGKNPSAAGDLALIFNYMKMLDPGSTVREGEFATAQNSAGVPDRVRAMYNKVHTGERLADGTRNDFVGRATQLYSAQLRGQEQLERMYSGLAKRSGANADDVIIDYRVPEQKPAAPPKAPANSATSAAPTKPGGWKIERVK